MLNKIKAFWNVFKIGQQVSDPAKWKSNQVSATVLAALIVALVQLAKLFNIDLPIDDEAATAIAAAVIAIVNVVLTVITSRKVGLSVATDKHNSAENSSETPVEKAAVEASNAHIDDETRERAKQWAKQQTSNGLQNDA